MDAARFISYVWYDLTYGTKKLIIRNVHTWSTHRIIVLTFDNFKRFTSKSKVLYIFCSIELWVVQRLRV